MNQSPIAERDFRFGGRLERDPRGRLYDCRFRDMARAMRSGRPDLNLHAVEALAALKAANRAIQLLMERWAEQHGLSQGRLQVLFRLLRAEGHRLPLGELAEELDVSPRNITGLVDRLESAGLVERVPDPSDRRSTQAHLTDPGLAKIRSIWRQALELPIPFVAGFSQEELVQLRHLCLRLVERISQSAHRPAAHA